MPDFERFVDQLRLEFVKRPEDFARAQGFIAGKRFARKQMAIAALIAAVAVVLAWTVTH